jgi:hypothetical protein
MSVQDFENALKETVFSEYPRATKLDLFRFLRFIDKHQLDPFERDAYITQAINGLRPAASIDGWINMVNNHEDFDGVEFAYSDSLVEVSQNVFCPAWVRCTMYHKNRQKPISIVEYLDECLQQTDYWRALPKRQLRHKAYIQCARVAFGLTGIGDPFDIVFSSDTSIVSPKVSLTPPKEVAKETSLTPEDIRQYVQRIPQCGSEALLALAEERYSGSDLQTLCAAIRDADTQSGVETTTSIEKQSVSTDPDSLIFTKLSEVQTPAPVASKSQAFF